MGQKAKYSLGVDVFRFTPESGLRSDIAPCPKSAKLKHRRNCSSFLDLFRSALKQSRLTGHVRDQPMSVPKTRRSLCQAGSVAQGSSTGEQSCPQFTTSSAARLLSLCTRRSDAVGPLLLLRHHVPRWRNGRFRRFLRNRERQPGIPARRPICRIELAISLQVQVPLHVFDRENIAELRTYAENPRPEASKNRVPADVVRDLLIGIADKTDKDLLREKLRRTPIQMEIDAALDLRIRILEIVGKAGDG